MLLLRNLILAVMALVTGACSVLPSQDGSRTEYTVEPVIRMDEITIPGQGRVSYVSGEASFAQYPSGGKFVPLRIGAAIQHKTMLYIGPQASVSIEFGSGGSIQFSAAPQDRNVFFVAESPDNLLNPSANRSVE